MLHVVARGMGWMLTSISTSLQNLDLTNSKCKIALSRTLLFQHPASALPRILRVVASGAGRMLTSTSTSSVLAVPRNATTSPTPSTSHTPNCSGDDRPSPCTAPLRSAGSDCVQLQVETTDLAPSAGSHSECRRYEHSQNYKLKCHQFAVASGRAHALSAGDDECQHHD